MANYKVTIVESMSKIVDVEASNAEEAERIVSDMYNDAEIVLDYADFDEVDFITFKDE